MENSNNENVMSNDRVYISGPMSSLSREEYTRRFMLAEQLLRQQGYQHIVNPIRIWACRFPRFHQFLAWLLGERQAYILVLLYDLWLLTRCNRIYKLPDWRNSRGAQVESCVAFHFSVFTVAKPVREVVDAALAPSDHSENSESSDYSDHSENSDHTSTPSTHKKKPHHKKRPHHEK